MFSPSPQQFKGMVPLDRAPDLQPANSARMAKWRAGGSDPSYSLSDAMSQVKILEAFTAKGRDAVVALQISLAAIFSSPKQLNIQRNLKRGRWLRRELCISRRTY